MQHDMYGNPIPADTQPCAHCGRDIYRNAVGSYTHVGNASNEPGLCYNAAGDRCQATPTYCTEESPDPTITCGLEVPCPKHTPRRQDPPPAGERRWFDPVLPWQAT